ncbi:hypothetical protein JCM11491_000066 [Sporobolomyces phaffii]
MANDSPPAAAELEPISSRQLAGHIGHLTPEQDATLAEFKTRLASGGYFTPAEGNAAPSHDDVTLVRFLRARKFDLDGAYAQFTAAEDWRKENDVDALYDAFDLAEFNSAARLYPQWTGRRDRSGLPVYVFKVSSLTKKATDEYAKHPDRLNPRMIALYEHMVQFVLPLCSSIPHTHESVPISGCATIVDISNVSLMRFWQLKAHMQRASALASANYAETLGAIYLVGAPNFFSTVWGWVKSWFDPGTVEKIFILPSHSVLSTLATHIDPASIPQEFGGSLAWQYGDDARPNLDQDTKDMLGLDEVPAGPVRWFGKERGCELRGTGRDRATEDEIERQLESRRSSRRNSPGGATPASASPATTSRTPAESEPATPAPTSTSSPAVGATQGEVVAAPPPVGMAGLDLPVVASESAPDAPTDGVTVDGPTHDISVAARENPAAPVKDLAATLEGTTL